MILRLAHFCTLLLPGTCLLLPSSQSGAQLGGEVLVVRHGGRYTGRFTSPNSAVPCVLIKTAEPVVLDGCTLHGAGDLIVAEPGARLTVRNCRGYGLTPSADNISRGRFLSATEARSLRVEHNYFEHTIGILVYRWGGDGSVAQTLTVRYNRVRNIDGRYRNGEADATASFLGLNQVRGVAGIDISYNEVVNEPNQCATGDVVNFYNSSGTARSPIRFFHNYIQGAYPYPATAPHYTGTGLTTDGDGVSALTTTAYVEAAYNQIVSTCNAAMNIAAGHHNRFHHNRMVTSGLLPDGQVLKATYAATSIFNAYRQPKTVFFGNRVDHNVIGYAKPGYQVPAANRHDLSSGNCTGCTDNEHLPNPITLATEQQEWQRWQHKLQRRGIRLPSAQARHPPFRPLAQR
ncbi:hypothetical protein LJ737_14875 [Hymenobacter sp. 15J16-1T3B]|uniref:hypothetical protein n=1 Tax=Hymenobacter sp. 15J16-1T3B TaxID=2886941 RepID=UPI001D0F8E05|nr:hypothetical protein [Hymenobacter sp. 15J16-1T3B]MCC3158531.1 hypothetical protein [Hymenobacter sp. 15J16-1T3B]